MAGLSDDALRLGSHRDRSLQARASQHGGQMSPRWTRLVADSLTDSMKFHDYVASEFTKRVQYSGDPITYFAEHGLTMSGIGTRQDVTEHSRGTSVAVF